MSKKTKKAKTVKSAKSPKGQDKPEYPILFQDEKCIRIGLPLQEIRKIYGDLCVVRGAVDGVGAIVEYETEMTPYDMQEAHLQVRAADRILRHALDKMSSLIPKQDKMQTVEIPFYGDFSELQGE